MAGNGYPLHVGIIAGEASGDNIAAGLIQAIREIIPDAFFEGVAGPRMKEAGCFSLYPMERLSVMGLTEVIGHLPGLLSMRRDLYRKFTETPPDIFIGVDAPDFNLPLELRLKKAGIRTLHYVSPSVWAWRQYRVRKIAESVDCMLTLFPFEEAFYREHDVPVRCVGHPMADLIADHVDPDIARRHLGIDHDGPVISLLPGSRAGEVKRLAGPFLETAAWCYRKRRDIHFVVPLANAACEAEFEKARPKSARDLPLTVLTGQSLEAMAAADAILMSSGTATLEAMLLKRPMAVAYRLSPLTYRLAKHLVKSRYFSLPNLLAGEPLVKEFIQGDVRVEAMGRELLSLLEDTARVAALAGVFSKIHEDLRRNASRVAADTVMELVNGGEPGNA